MKPRLVPRLLTEEDCEIWAWVAWRWRPRGTQAMLRRSACEADRRDADIMRKAGHWRREGITEPVCFRGRALPWYIEQGDVRIHVGGCVGRYL
jgi:hypothetical protein